VDLLSNKLNKYSIRKFTVGTASILVGATMMFGVANNNAKAAEENQAKTTTKTSENDIRNSNQSNLDDVTTTENLTKSSELSQTVTNSNSDTATQEQMITESASEKNISTQNLSTKENTTSQTQSTQTTEKKVIQVNFKMNKQK